MDSANSRRNICFRWARTRKQKLSITAAIFLPLLIIICLVLTVIIRAAVVEDYLHIIKLSKEAVFINGTRKLERAQRLGRAISIPTVSKAQEDFNRVELLQLHELLRNSFPAIHNSSLVTFEVINTYSLLYTVHGSESDHVPYLLTSHLDVVPVVNETWDLDPFLGEVTEEKYIYGRGAIDAKHSVMGILEALEYLLHMNWQPKRTFYIAFGHDEEIQGYNGAQKIAEVLKMRGVSKLDFLLDEGMFVLADSVPGVERPVAIIGVSEKGYAIVEVTATGTAGHASVPHAKTAISSLAKAIVNLQEEPQPNMFGTGPEYDLLQYVAPYSSFGYKVVFSNLWLFSGIVSSMFSKKHTTNALIRTTSAITIISGGYKSNVIPSSATAVINHRIHPGQTVEEVLQHDRRVIDDPVISVKLKNSFPPHPVSPYGNEADGFQLIALSVKQVFPEAVIAPGILVANTDSKWYLNFTANVYRFTPAFLYPEDISRFHGDNERITVDNYQQVVNFYYCLMVNADLILQGRGSTHTPEL